MVSLLLNRTIYSSVSLHIGDVKEKSGGFGIWSCTQTQSCPLPPAPSAAGGLFLARSLLLAGLSGMPSEQAGGKNQGGSYKGAESAHMPSEVNS